MPSELPGRAIVTLIEYSRFSGQRSSRQQRYPDVLLGLSAREARDAIVERALDILADSADQSIESIKNSGQNFLWVQGIGCI